MTRSFSETATLEVAKVLEPLTRIRSVGAFLADLGWSPGAIAGDLDLSGLGTDVQNLITAALAVSSAATDEEREQLLAPLVAQALAVIEGVREAVPRIIAAAPDLTLLAADAAGAAGELARRLFDWLLHVYLEVHRPRILAVLHLLGIADTEPGPGRPIRRIYWDRIGLLFTDPLGLAEKVYHWRTGFDGDELLARLDFLLRAFAIPGGMYRQIDSVRTALGRDAGARELRIPLFRMGRWPDTYAELDVNLSPVPAVGGKQAGLVLYPYLYGGLAIEQSIAEGWELRVRGTADFAAGLGVELRAPHELAVSTSLFGGGTPGLADARLEVGITRKEADDTPIYLFGSEEESHLAVRQVGANLLVAMGGGSQEIAAELDIVGLAIRVSAGKADGFLQKILEGIDIRTSCDLCFGFSSLRGVYFRGSGALEIEIPIHETLGPIRIDSLLIGAAVSEEGIEGTLAATFGAELGPISASVEEIGLTIPIGFRGGNDGNLGPLHVDTPRFKPPTGAGLSLDAGGIVGGGFLTIDTDAGRYAGVLGLKFGEIGLTAIGLIQTKTPDGRDTFSMLINIGVIFDPPIELSMGFGLAGVGGLIGINRNMLTEELQKGIKNRTLDSILFPDPATVVANAPKIISDLETVFPTAEGRFVIGPMVKISWGTPKPLITADIGIFLSLPDPFAVALMGQVEATFPTVDEAVVEIHMDVLGILDLGRKQLSFQSRIYDSTVLVYTLRGDTAFLLEWGDHPAFALSIGGFHPKFDPPPPPIIFAGLERLSLELSSGKDFSISCGGYMALTPNSLQFGARIDLYAAAAGAEVKGHLGFDALFIFSPFSMEVSISGAVSIRVSGQQLADIRLEFMLSGPTPWNARGKAIIKVLFFDIDVGFDFTWGSRKTVSAPSEDPLPKVLAAFGSPRSWGSVLPRGRTSELLRSRAGAEADELVVHPAGTLEVKQKVAPLGIKLSRFGNGPVTGHDRFAIESIQAGRVQGGTFVPSDPGEPPALADVTELFARGQFESLSNQRKLSVPSFEKMVGGARTKRADQIVAGGAVESRELSYESIVIGPDLLASERPAGKKPYDGEGEHLLRGAARARKRGGGLSRFATAGGAKVGVDEDTYAIVHLHDLTRVDPSLPDMTRTEADQVLAERQAADASLAGTVGVVPSWEAEAA